MEKLKDEKGDIQVSALVYTMGRQAENFYKSFKFDVPEPPDPKGNFKAVLQRFDDYFVPHHNTVHNRTKFYLPPNSKAGPSNALSKASTS